MRDSEMKMQGELVNEHRGKQKMVQHIYTRINY